MSVFCQQVRIRHQRCASRSGVPRGNRPSDLDAGGRPEAVPISQRGAGSCVILHNRPRRRRNGPVVAKVVSFGRRSCRPMGCGTSFSDRVPSDWPGYYPGLTGEDLHACLKYASAVMQSERECIPSCSVNVAARCSPTRTTGRGCRRTEPLWRWTDGETAVPARSAHSP